MLHPRSYGNYATPDQVSSLIEELNERFRGKAHFSASVTFTLRFDTYDGEALGDVRDQLFAINAAYGNVGCLGVNKKG